ncbi:ABC transporter substrate-binding protein [Terrihabitans rhizophilus]|uniref:ABC transporter substrate-binding protein n=1 Tax=Terrihabitans rhizophilus TaxID=3092662 RepID=A0ABU4RPJ2_9HYPH|nr:ABC transporter substrate-binding protein [Terrihabitans sp. PJ23]MDX6806752.1 ABC transporter substrate-binding protein [Terrihabitans sp. PJ23]
MAGTVKVAFGDIASVEQLNLLIAFERAKERGVDVQTTFFKSEDLAAQAVVGRQADVGIGTPYALLQKVKAPIRLFYQISNLRFYPVVNTEFYKDWKDLDGQEFAVHSRGSGTEAIMNLMAQKHGIKFSKLSYVPGAEVRAGALLQGNVKATIIDSSALRLVKEKGGDKYKALEMGDINASDEALYANTAFLESSANDVQILVEELLKTQREINKDPKSVVALRAKYKLLPDLPKDLEGEVEPYFEDAVSAKLYPDDGGSAAAVKSDFEFYTVAGQLKGDAGQLKAEDFWSFQPLEKARAALGS